MSPDLLIYSSSIILWTALVIAFFLLYKRERREKDIKLLPNPHKTGFSDLNKYFNDVRVGLNKSNSDMHKSSSKAYFMAFLAASISFLLSLWSLISYKGSW